METQNPTTPGSQPKTKVYNLIILDKSGSMEDIRQEAINGHSHRWV